MKLDIYFIKNKKGLKSKLFMPMTAIKDINIHKRVAIYQNHLIITSCTYIVYKGKRHMGIEAYEHRSK